jgi:hypothetical protein
MNTELKDASQAGHAEGVSGMTPQIITDAQSITDYLTQSLPLSNVERQWLYQERKKAEKQYHHCLHCAEPLMRQVGQVDGQAYHALSPTDDWESAFCRNNDGACRSEYLKTDTVVRHRAFGGEVPQPLGITLLPTSEQWDNLRAESDTAGTRPAPKNRKTKSTGKLRRKRAKSRRIGFTDQQMTTIAERLVDDLIEGWVAKKR